MSRVLKFRITGPLPNKLIPVVKLSPENTHFRIVRQFAPKSVISQQEVHWHRETLEWSFTFHLWWWHSPFLTINSAHIDHLWTICTITPTLKQKTFLLQSRTEHTTRWIKDYFLDSRFGLLQSTCKKIILNSQRLLKEEPELQVNISTYVQHNIDLHVLFGSPKRSTDHDRMEQDRLYTSHYNLQINKNIKLMS